MVLNDMTIESYEKRIDRNRKDIDRTLNAMNEGKISVSDAKDMIHTYSEINKDLLDRINTYRIGLSRSTVGNYENI